MRDWARRREPSESRGAAPPSIGEPADGMARPRIGISGALAFLRAHPVVCLLLLSPGIPEYLSGSSPLDAIVLDPGQFLFQVVANLGLYGPGVLLIREAMVRWNKGWGSVLLMGAAYAILEEGIALSTLFNPAAGPVGSLGHFGHWLGVSWVWLAEIIPVHMVFSISIPILLLGLALPNTRGRSLLSRRGVVTASAILAIDVTTLFLFVVMGVGFWMGTPVLVGSLLAMGGLVLLASRIPAAALHARNPLPRRRPRVMVLVGMAFFPTVLIFERLFPTPVVSFAAVIAVQALFLLYVLREMGSSGNELQLLAFTFGLVTPIAIVGVVSQVQLPLVLVGDAAWAAFNMKLWRRYKMQVRSMTPAAVAAGGVTIG